MENRDWHTSYTSAMYGAKAAIFFRSGRLIRQTERSRIAIDILEGWTTILNIFLVDNNQFSARFHDEDSSLASVFKTTTGIESTIKSQPNGHFFHPFRVDRLA